MAGVLWSTALLPALVVLVLALVASAVGRFSWWRPALAGGVALVAGFLAGVLAVVGGPAWPPVDARSWLFVLGPGALIVGLACEYVGRPSFDRVATICWAALVPPLLLAPLARHAWGPWQTAAMFLATAAAIVLLAESLARLERRGPLEMLACAFVFALLGAPLLVLGASALFGQLSGVLAASLATLVLLTITGWPTRAPRALVHPLATLGAILVGTGMFYAELPAAAAALAIVAPAAAAAGVGIAGRRPGRVRTLATAVLLTAVPLLIAVVLAYRAYEPPGSYGY
ncbi:MAG: hypothetical protein D6738_11515 [Acidobacteria bacterium]|nr:MAG: hypothetical protein D6738_11515 [Acidobacteriota bacterium]